MELLKALVGALAALAILALGVYLKWSIYLQKDTETAPAPAEAAIGGEPERHEQVAHSSKKRVAICIVLASAGGAAAVAVMPLIVHPYLIHGLHHGTHFNSRIWTIAVVIFVIAVLSSTGFSFLAVHQVRRAAADDAEGTTGCGGLNEGKGSAAPGL